MESSNIKKPVESLEGRILIATPSLDNSYFEKTVIYIYAHDEEGALGTIINKPIKTDSYKDIQKEFNVKRKNILNKKMVTYMGGPINEKTSYVLSADKEQKRKFTKEKALTLFTNAEEFIADAISGKQKNDFIYLKGFCGWGEGQIEAEIEENSWIVLDVEYSNIFSNRKKRLWNELIKKTGIKNFDNLVPYSGNA